MISVDKFLPHVVPYADGVPQEIARRAVVKAAHELCVHSLVWQVESDWEGVCSCDDTVRFCVPEECVVIKVMDVTFNGWRLKMTNANQIGSDHHHLAWVGRTCYPLAVIQPSLGAVKLVPWPKEHGWVRARLALAPSLDARCLPDDLYERFCPAIVNGTLADLKQMEGQTFSNVEAAMVYKELFAQGVRDARVEANRSLGRNTGKVPFRRIV